MRPKKKIIILASLKQALKKHQSGYRKMKMLIKNLVFVDIGTTMLFKRNMIS